MPVSWQQLYADRTGGMRASDIREILKVTAQPDIISLAGGLPAPELFPVDEYRRAFEWVLETDGAVALQYGPSEGYRPLRTLLAERLSGFGMPCTPDDVLITHGSQQALDLIGKIFLNPGDTVLVEKPTYLGALQAFNQYQATYAAVPMDEDGMCVDDVENVLIRAGKHGQHIKFIYALPNFQNPSGRTIAADRRAGLAAAAASAGADVSLWLSGDAVWLATPGRAAGFDLAHAAPLDGMLDLLLGAGTVTVCHQCATRRGIALADLIPGIEMAGASSYVDEILRPDTQVVVH